MIGFSYFIFNDCKYSIFLFFLHVKFTKLHFNKYIHDILSVFYYTNELKVTFCHIENTWAYGLRLESMKTENQNKSRKENKI